MPDALQTASRRRERLDIGARARRALLLAAVLDSDLPVVEVDAGRDAGRLAASDTGLMPLRLLIALALLPALSPGAVAQARPLTTTPQYVLNIHVTITDARIVLAPHSAPRGVTARFVIKNTGTKAHNFTLNGKTTPEGVRQAFTRTLKPKQQDVVQLFLDRRARIPYFDALPSEKQNAAMRGLFVIR